MNQLNTYVFDDIVSYCNFDTKIIMSLLYKKIFYGNIKLFSSIIHGRLDNILVYGVHNESEKLIKYALKRGAIILEC